MSRTVIERCPRKGGTRSRRSTSGVRISAMIPAKMKSNSTLKTCSRMNDAPSQIQMSARMIASHTSARSERDSSSACARGRGAVAVERTPRGAARPLTSELRRAEAARLDGDVLKIEATQFAGTGDVMRVEQLQATNQLTCAGDVHLITPAQPRDCSERKDVPKRETPVLDPGRRAMSNSKLLIEDQGARLTAEHLCRDSEAIQRLLELQRSGHHAASGWRGPQASRRAHTNGVSSRRTLSPKVIAIV